MKQEFKDLNYEDLQNYIISFVIGQNKKNGSSADSIISNIKATVQGVDDMGFDF